MKLGFSPRNGPAVRLANSPFGPRGVPVSPSAELTRIAELPRRPQVDLKSMTAQAIVLRETAKYARDRSDLGQCRCRLINPDQGCITTLLPQQAVVTREISMAGGVVAALPVGAGKSMLDILAPLALGLSATRDEQALLLVPANLIKQICDDYELVAEHFQVPTIIVHRPGGDWRRVVPGQPVLRVMTHNAISLPKESDFIDRLRPAAIIIDECDGFGSLTSARTMRLLRVFRDFGEQTKFCCWTGSMADKSHTEFAHLFAFALKDRSPMPLDSDVTEDIARCLDATDSPCPPGALMQLVTDVDVGNSDVTRARSAFRRRLAETMGFVVTGTIDVMRVGSDDKTTSDVVGLDVVARAVPEIPEIVILALEKVRGMKRPDTLAGAEFDDPIADELEQAQVARQVACGMYYYAHFKRNEPQDLIKEWYAAKSAWFCERREEKLKGVRFMDSEKLCEDAAKRAHGDLPEDDTLPSWKASNWEWWRDIQKREWRDAGGRVQIGVKPEQRAHRLKKGGDFLVKDAAQWGLDNKGLIWYGMVELGEWIAELSGLPLHGGGAKAEEMLKAEMRSGRNRSMIVSIKSHGRGRNGLQHHFANQYVINTLASGKWWEQVLGRLHRTGQRGERVHTEVCLHTPELRKSFDQALRRSDYVYDTFSQILKLRKAIPK